MWKLHLIEDMERKVSVAENGTYYELIIATLEKFHKLMCLNHPNTIMWISIENCLS